MKVITTFRLRQLACFAILLFTVQHVVFAQKKQLDHADYHRWRSIQQPLISADGKTVVYTTISNGFGDPAVFIHDAAGKKLLSYERGKSPKFTADGQHVIFTITPGEETIKTLKKAKTKEDKMPKDTLAIYHVSLRKLTKIPQLKQVDVPEKWNGWIVYQKHFLPDSTDKSSKKSSVANGFPTTIMRLSDQVSWELPYVTSYAMGKERGLLATATNGKDSLAAGVYVFDVAAPGFTAAHISKAKITGLNVDDAGTQITFLQGVEATTSKPSKYQLWYWSLSGNKSEILLSNQDERLPLDHLISEHKTPYFSQDGKKLYFGIAPKQIEPDSTRLDEEIVNVEVWHYLDPKMHTQQKVDKKNDVKKNYLSYIAIQDRAYHQLATYHIPDVETGTEGNADVFIGTNNQPYLIFRTWDAGVDRRDVFLKKGTSDFKLIASGLKATPRLSPEANYAYWFDYADSAWFAYHIASENLIQLTQNTQVKFYDEEEDTPSLPGPYGIAGWTENDEYILIYDRYDIWEIDPLGIKAPKNLTKSGRPNQITYRYVKTDPDEKFIKKGQSLILSTFYHTTKNSGFAWLTYGSEKIQDLVSGPYRYRIYQKAKNANAVLFSFENFQQFPDLYISTLPDFKKPVRISNVNPQQANYQWGNAKLYSFRSLDGQRLDGILITPEGFDPKKKYPLIVNFYEKSADGLYQHRAPEPHRSTINYAFYASRGYVIFNPDIVYKTGYPGESAYNCVMGGVMQLLNEGFIDEKRMGLQGHSWGGYQIGYILTRTQLFACAEAGAPVPNMISAYGGIRWETGLSRAFQYEKTQSRIGASIWEEPMRFIENSPIFFADKIKTPLLLMHNDADGHVPWYQGIEFYVAMRRLGNPTWMLNYQGEPHWPLKLQNRLDFNVRLQQFFDHYLLGQSMPVWMRDGVPAKKVGVEQGLELID